MRRGSRVCIEFRKCEEGTVPYGLDRCEQDDCFTGVLEYQECQSVLSVQADTIVVNIIALPSPSSL